jgi:hypothetical protein
MEQLRLENTHLKALLTKLKEVDAEEIDRQA